MISQYESAQQERERGAGGTVRSLLTGLSSPHAMGEALVLASIFLQHTDSRSSPREAAHETAGRICCHDSSHRMRVCDRRCVCVCVRVSRIKRGAGGECEGQQQSVRGSAGNRADGRVLEGGFQWEWVGVVEKLEPQLALGGRCRHSSRAPGC